MYKKAYRRKNRNQADINTTRSICAWHHSYIHFANIPDGMEPAEFFRRTGRPPLFWGGKDQTVKLLFNRELVKIPYEVYREHFAHLPKNERLIMPTEKIIWLLTTSVIALSQAMEKKVHRKWQNLVTA